ncbi:MAG: hypothetical protein JWL88_594, partial [Parcubacteria group bacterium]|nr:hypothetical protein [Parcubacteria group bacterium]
MLCGAADHLHDSQKDDRADDRNDEAVDIEAADASVAH